MNKQNIRFGLKFSLIEQRQLGVEKVTVLCALGRNDIIGLYWLEDADGRPVTVNTAGILN